MEKREKEAEQSSYLWVVESQDIIIFSPLFMSIFQFLRSRSTQSTLPFITHTFSQRVSSCPCMIFPSSKSLLTLILLPRIPISFSSKSKFQSLQIYKGFSGYADLQPSLLSLDLCSFLSWWHYMPLIKGMDYLP